MLGVAFIDIAIFFTIGALWIFGTGFIIVLYKWIAGFEAAEAERLATATPVATPATSDVELQVAEHIERAPEERLAS